MLMADAAFDFSSITAQPAQTVAADVSSNGGAVLQINLHDVLQTEPSNSTDSFGVVSALAATAPSYINVAHLLPDPNSFI